MEIDNLRKGHIDEQRHLLWEGVLATTCIEGLRRRLDSDVRWASAELLIDLPRVLSVLEDQGEQAGEIRPPASGEARRRKTLGLLRDDVQARLGNVGHEGILLGFSRGAWCHRISPASSVRFEPLGVFIVHRPGIYHLEPHVVNVRVVANGILPLRE